ncbi:MAG: sugar ABC transporter ATP-binding protein, partial [Christensenellaceae bacterium]|nr:sugar ABC transporter ATP-binding protein [Christensenellaceae bacterium]
MSILKMSGITKRFPGVVALNNASLDVNEGEVHILVGENGAGKSTLMKILTGAYSLEEGDIEIAGEKFTRITPRAAQENGISMIYQELNLVQEMSVAENIFLGREQKSKAIPAKIDWKRLYGETETILKDLGLSIDPTARVSSLGIAEQQMVEVAKALSKNARIIIMDEPTAVLTEKEIDKLFSIIKKIKQEGVAIIYISHRMEEFERIGDRITVMRDGMTIKTLGIDECTIPDLIKLMVGRDLTEKFPSVEKSIGSERLRVEGLCREGVLKNISFSVNSGEILGIAGLMGCGRTEMANAIFGVDKISAGKIFIDGKPVKITSPRKAIASGIGFVTEDRKKQGLVLTMSVAHNITLVDLNNFVKFGKIAL